MIDIPICVLTCDKYLWMLRPFAFLFNEFWGRDQEVRIYGYKSDPHILKDVPYNFSFHSINKNVYPVRRWSDGLIEMIGYLKCEHFILFLEDYWLYNDVHLYAVETMIEYAQKNPDPTERRFVPPEEPVLVLHSLLSLPAHTSTYPQFLTSFLCIHLNK